MTTRLEPKRLALAEGETASVAAAAHAEALIKARCSMAVMRPRDMDRVRERLVAECHDFDFANDAIWEREVGRDIIRGLTIRFAEEAAQIMGNVSCDSILVHDDPERRVLRVFATDLESNTTYTQDVTIAKTVDRHSTMGRDVLSKRTTSKNKILYTIPATEDEFLEKQNAHVSQATRVVLCRLLPSKLRKEAFSLCAETVRKGEPQRRTEPQKRTEPQRGGAPRSAPKPKPASDFNAEVFQAFESVGVAPEDLCGYLGCDPAALNEKARKELEKLFCSIRDKVVSWADVVGEKDKQGEQAPGEDGQ